MRDDRRGEEMTRGEERCQKERADGRRREETGGEGTGGGEQY